MSSKKAAPSRARRRAPSGAQKPTPVFQLFDVVRLPALSGERSKRVGVVMGIQQHWRDEPSYLVQYRMGQDDVPIERVLPGSNLEHANA